jgi:hypothetical protein
MAKFFFGALRACALGLLGWSFPRLLVASGVPLDRWIVKLSSGILGAGHALTSEIALWLATIITALILFGIEWWW